MTTNGKSTLPARRVAFTDLGNVHDTLRAMLDPRWPFGTKSPIFADIGDAAIDMFERNGSIVVKAELPGVPADKIEVTVVGGELRINGERSEEKEIKEEDYYYAERKYGRVFRSVALPDGCDADAVKATSKDGVVEIVIARKPAATNKKIEVKAG